jgi:4-methyl-5(b-hydroxyethyl)-thiazole monophosphate biosynthesis
MVLARAGIVKGRRVTSYPADDFRSLFPESDYVDDELVVVDDHMITSRGPATAFLFAYALVDLLGGDSASLKEDMLVNRAIAKIRS